MANLTITVGRLLSGHFRDFLDQCKFKGMEIDYLESSGWIKRDFVIKGSNEDMLKIDRIIQKWMNDYNKS